MASKLPIPRYFLSLTPSWKKKSPGDSVVPANNDPIITVRKRGRKVGIEWGGGGKGEMKVEGL